MALCCQHLLLVIALQIGLAVPQPDQNFLFNQGRFIPSFQNPRNGFFPTAGDSSSYRQQQLQNVPASGYLNAQSLFKGSELPYTTEGYFPYSAVPNAAQSDYYEISPRPFTLPPNTNSNAFQYAKPPPRPFNYQQQPQSQQFFSSQQYQTLPPVEFNAAEPVHQEQLGLSNPINQRPSKLPYQSSRVRPYVNTQNSHQHDEQLSDNDSTYNFRVQPQKKANEYVTSHESSIISKNRFQTTAISSTPTSIAPSTTIKAFSPTPTSRRTRFNPYRSIVTQKARARSTTKTTTIATPPAILRTPQSRYQNLIPIQPTHAEEKHISYKNSSILRATQLQLPKTTIIDFDDEESNKSSKDFGSNAGYILDYKDDYDYPTDTPVATANIDGDDSLLNPVEYVKKNFNLLDTNKEVRTNEKDEAHPSSIAPILNIINKTSSDVDEPANTEQPLILHSNFYLPNSNTANKEQKYVQETEETTNHDGIEYEYEYEDYEDDTTAVPVISSTTAAVSTVMTSKQPNVVVDFKSEPIESDTLPANNYKSNTDEVLSKAVVSVVTTKSVVNGTANLTDLVDKKANYQVVTDDVVDDSLEANNFNGSTESWVVVASVQTSRSVSGARFLPFPQVEQEEKKKQVLSDADLDIKTSEDEEGDFEDDVINEDLLDNSTTIEHTTTGNILQEPEYTTTDLGVDDDFESTTKSLLTLNETDEIMNSPSTEHQHIVSQSTESIIDKLDRVQSELSSGLLSGKFPIINNVPVVADQETTTATIETVLSPGTPKTPPVLIRRFTPRTSSTTKAPDAKVAFDDLPMDDLTAGLLPFGFKPRNNSYRNKKVTTSTTTTTRSPTTSVPEVRNRSAANISRSFKSHPTDQNTTNTEHKSIEEPKDDVLRKLLSKIKFEENLEALLPKDYKPVESTTARVTVTDNVNLSKFLPPGYKVTKKPVVTASTDSFNKFLPPGYKLMEPTAETKKAAAFIPVAGDDIISKFLPPGYKPPSDADEEQPSVIPIADDIVRKLLPSGYKPAAKKVPTNPLQPKIHKFSDNGVSKSHDNNNDLVNDILRKDEVTTSAPTTKSSGFKVVFPKALGKRPGAPRLTTPRPLHAEGPAQPGITIRKGLRSTTEFTGWPSPATTPFSIEKLLELQRAESIDISELLGGKTSTTSTSTTTTTTTTTTVRPTHPGLCHGQCDLAGTIKIIDGVKWSPELLDHNTEEWKNLARDVEAQLNEVYNKSNNLSKWYKKIRIDSFSKGSVLVDYFVELTDLSQDINTLEIKRMFHEALRKIPVSVIPLQHHKSDTNDDEAMDNDGGDEMMNVEENGHGAVGLTSSVKASENFMFGQFTLDPVATDFIVIPKQMLPPVEYAEQYSLIPQWAIAVIVIGLASLLFVIVFGVGVLIRSMLRKKSRKKFRDSVLKGQAIDSENLVNRQKKSKKKQPAPLTAEMLNELNKNHMGGLEEYRKEELYNPEDTWSENKHAIKTKRLSNSMHGSSSNIYDSWRSQHRHMAPPSVDQHHYYDTHNYQMKSPGYPPPLPPDPYSMMEHHPHHPNAMGLYTYNTRRYHRDYDPEF